MKSMINKMLKKAGLEIYSMFTKWKLDTFTDAERRRALRRNKILNAAVDSMEKKLKNHLKAGFARTAGDSLAFGMRKKVVNRLVFVGFGRLRNAFNDWKADTFRKFAEERERKVAKVIDEFIRQSMSPLQKAFMKWARKMRDALKYEFAQ